MKNIETVLYIVITFLLIFCAGSDVKKRKIPFTAGLALLVSVDIILALQHHYLEAVFLLVAVIGSRGGIWSLLVWISAICMVSGVGEAKALPMVVGILLFYVMFSMKWLAGGDAQVAYALVALSRDWTIFYWLLGITTAAGLILVFYKYGFVKSFSRLWEVLHHLNKKPDTDAKAIRSPWVLWATIGGLCYLFISPAPLLNLLANFPYSITW